MSIHKQEDGTGFVESLVAMIISGMACIALLGLLAGVIRESVNNEIRDSMNQYAVEGMERVRWYVLQDGVADLAAPGDYYLTESGDDLVLNEIDVFSSVVPPTYESLDFNDNSGYFYRYFHVTAGGSSNSRTIEVRVGIVRDDSDDDDYMEQILGEREITGLVTD